MHDCPTLSIIISTIGRKDELRNLFESIDKYSIDRLTYEIIVVDQNDQSYLQNIKDAYSQYKWCNVSFRGLSRAKNYGVSIAKGEWLVFPDDDCEFLKSTMQTIYHYIMNNSYDVVSGRCIDRGGNTSVAKFNLRPYRLELQTIEGGFIEAASLVRRSVFDYYLFDEKVGAGCFHGAEEGFDWIYRILKGSSYKVFFDPEFIIYHPQVVLDKSNLANLYRVFYYRAGFAYINLKHRLYARLFRRIIVVLLGIFTFSILNKIKARYYVCEFLGLLAGIFLKPR